MQITYAEGNCSTTACIMHCAVTGFAFAQEI